MKNDSIPATDVEREEKFELLEEIEGSEDFVETFKEDYQLLRHNDMIQTDSVCFEHLNVIRNLVILFQFTNSKGISVRELLSLDEIVWLQEHIPVLQSIITGTV